MQVLQRGYVCASPKDMLFVSNTESEKPHEDIVILSMNLSRSGNADMCSVYTLRWRHNGRDSVSNYQSHDCLLIRLLRRRSKKTSKLRITGLCVGNSPGTGEFPAQMASDAENVSIWWRHHDLLAGGSKQHWAASYYCVCFPPELVRDRQLFFHRQSIIFQPTNYYETVAKGTKLIDK